MFDENTFNDIVTGIYVSLLIVFAIRINEKIKLSNDFKYLEGEWTEFCPIDGYGSSFNFSNPTGVATIIYDDDNLLKIKLTTNSNKEIKDTWEGDIMMSKEFVKSGRISWKYNDPSNPANHCWGIKECYI